MNSSCDLVSHDHLDLLVSAAQRLALLVPTATAAFSPAAATSAGVVGTPTAAGPPTSSLDAGRTPHWSC